MRARGKCMRGGPITNNGYLNFLREFRSQHCGLSATEVVKKGAEQWNHLSCSQKSKYNNMSGCRRRSRSHRRKRCMKPGPVTNNGYLNFLRHYRRKHCGMSPVETVRKGACAWRRLSECEKDHYTSMGCNRGRRHHRPKRRRSSCARRRSHSRRRRSRSRIARVCRRR